MKREYYCLVAGLPDLFFNENKPGLSSLDFRDELKHQLDKPNFELVKLFFLPADNENLLNLLFQQNKPFNESGNLPKHFLDPDLEYPVKLPFYMTQFIKWVKIQESREFSLEFENLLHSMFYEFVLNEKNTFLREWFTFELNIKNVLTAINCKRFNYNSNYQLVQAGINSIVFTLMKSNRLKHEFFEEELPFAEQIFRVAESDSSSIEKEKSIDKIKWDYLDEETYFHYFTIEKILSFVIKLNITERWMKLDAKTGKELLDRLINELETSYEFPAEFSTVK
ncbi:MAG: DUF2764 family protein [Bacteroidetes bacterium]|nr:DUF2764 family protein [Bacteroidota bacterium]